MLYCRTNMATVGVKGLINNYVLLIVIAIVKNLITRLLLLLAGGFVLVLTPHETLQ